MRFWRPNRSLSFDGKKLREPLLLFRFPNLSSSQRISSPILFNSSESHHFSTLLTAEDEKYGFRRPEMYRSNLAGTVAAYERHVFLCYRSPEVWPSRVEDSNADLLPKLLSATIKARKNRIAIKVRKVIFDDWIWTVVSLFLSWLLLLMSFKILFIVYRTWLLEYSAITFMVLSFVVAC